MDSRVYYLSLAIVTLLYLLKSCVFSSKACNRGLRLPPGPWRLPVIGSLHHLIGALPHHALRDLSRRHGPLMFLKLGEIPVLVVSSAAAAKEVMKTHDIAVATRPVTTTIEILTRQGERVVMAPYGDHWRQLRKLCIVELLSTKRVQSFRRVREEEAASLVRSVSSASQAPQPVVNLSERLTAYVTDATVRAVLGDHFEDRDAFLRLVDDGVRIAGGFSLIDLFPSSRLVRLLSRTTVRRAVIYPQTLFAFMDGVVRQHLQRRSEDGGRHDNLIDVLLRIQREDGPQIPLATGTIHALIFVCSRASHLILNS